MHIAKSSLLRLLLHDCADLGNASSHLFPSAVAQILAPGRNALGALQGHEEYDDEITLAASGSATPPETNIGQVQL